MITIVVRAGISIALAALTINLAASKFAWAQAKTEVGVVFLLPDPRYTDEFRNEDIPGLTASAAAAVAGALDDKIRFLDFSTNPNARYRLTVRLDRAEGSRAEGPAEFGFHLSLKGPEVGEDARGYLVFRTKDEYLSSIGDQPALVREIELKFKHELDNNHTMLVKRLLKYVAIAENGDFYRQQQRIRWIIHQNRSALCLDKESRLQVRNAFPDIFGETVHHAFEAQVLDVDRQDDAIVSRPVTSRDDEMIEELMAADPPEVVEVERVFVIDYRRYCRQPISGDGVDFSQGGGAQ